MKRGQAAMEFLLTYGWAILVVIIAVGILAYFGVLNNKSLIGETCLGQAGLPCIEKATAANVYDGGSFQHSTVRFPIRNSLGKIVSIQSAELAEEDKDCGSLLSFRVLDQQGSVIPLDTAINNDRMLVFEMNCSNELGQVATLDFNVNYITEYADIKLSSTYHIVVKP